MKLDQNTMMPMGVVIALLSAVAVGSASGAVWVFQVSKELININERLAGIEVVLKIKSKVVAERKPGMIAKTNQERKAYE